MKEMINMKEPLSAQPEQGCRCPSPKAHSESPFRCEYFSVAGLPIEMELYPGDFYRNMAEPTT